MTAQEYEKLLNFAKFYLIKKPHLDPRDLVNDVVMQIIEQGKPFNLVEAERMVKHHPDVNAISLNKIGCDFARNDTERVCKDCKELLPVGMFWILNQKARRVVSSYCKGCAAKRKNAWQKTEKGKMANNKHQQNFIKKHPLRSKAQRESYNKKRKAELSDSYIRKLLYGKGYTKDFLMMPENYFIIEDYRNIVRAKLLNGATAIKN